MHNNSVYDKMTNAENMVSDYLRSMGLYWIFESPVFVKDDADRPRVWSPDFYLPTMGVYIEVACDPEHRNYEYRKMVYYKNQLPVIFVYPYDDRYWQKNLIDNIWNTHQMRYDILRRIKK